MHHGWKLPSLRNHPFYNELKVNLFNFNLRGNYYLYYTVVLQLLSHVWHFATPWTAACHASLSFTISWSLLKLLSMAAVMPSNHLILCYPFLHLASIIPSIKIFSSESAFQIRWPEYWSFSFSFSISSVQLLSHVRLFVTPWITARQASLSFTNSQSLPKPMSIESVMPSSHLLCHPLLLLPPILPSIRVFSNKSTLCMMWPKYWSTSSEYSGLISFRIDWFDLLNVQGTLKSLLQHHNWKPSILWHSTFFLVQLSHPSMTTGKTITLTRQTLLAK